MSGTIVRRTAVVAYSSRSRELIRRVLRALGHAPLVFANVDEFMALGPAVPVFDALLIGDAPDVDSQGRPVVACVRGAIGPKVPVLHAQMQKRMRVRRGLDDGSEVAAAAPRYFSDLYQTIVSFLEAHGIEGVPRPLVWGRYEFHPLGKTITFNGEELKMDAVDFDVALELFFNAGRPVATRWLTRMLPSGEHGANWHRIDNLACTVEELGIALHLDGSNGWLLERQADVGCQLLRVRPVVLEREAVVDRPVLQARLPVRRRVAGPVPEPSV